MSTRFQRVRVPRGRVPFYFPPPSPLRLYLAFSPSSVHRISGFSRIQAFQEPFKSQLQVALWLQSSGAVYSQPQVSFTTP